MAFELNDEQKEAVFYNGLKPLLIEAGAGSGKTRVMTERVKYLVERGEDPESILICTFSNKAASELKDRLINYTLEEKSIIKKSDINKMKISTIHSLCLDLLNEKGYSYEFLDDDYGERKLMFLSKFINELGFTGEAHASKSQIRKIADKFDEYISFGVDSERLIEYIKENRPIKDNYHRLIAENKEFPRDIIKEDKKLKEKGEGYDESWRNARYIQTVKAFPIYQKLLKEHNVTDFATVQVLTLNLLSKDPVTKYKHILVDEFQDTDPVQVRIFEILMNEALKNNTNNNIKGTFTAVGDMNQNIYGFRGASFNYFKKFNEDYDCKIIAINTNHRSSNEIIELSEDFIRSFRNDYSKQNIKPFKNLKRDCYYLKNDDSEKEACNIVKIIKHLVNTKKAEYKDILILYRSVINDSKELIESLELENIPYTVKGSSSIIETDEIRSILILLKFITKIEDDVPFYSKYSPWLYSLKGFTGEFFKPMWNLSDETKAILNKIQDEYEEEVFKKGKIVEEEMGLNTKKRTFKTMFDHDREVLDEIFKDIKEPFLTNEFLIENGVSNEDDLKFFNKLFNIRANVFDNQAKEETILSIYYKLLDICGYLSEEFIKNPDNMNIISNIALITNTISNYQDIVSKTNIMGLFWYLNLNIREYKSPSHEEDGVKIMTVHEAKGLEYPITIIPTLRVDKFPLKYKNDEDLGKHKVPYYTPNDFFKYKTPQDQEKSRHDDEEMRILYVAMTRAQDTIIFSISPKKYKRRKTMDVEDVTPKSIQGLIDRNPNILKELDMNNLDVIEAIVSPKEAPEEEKLGLSYSSISRYKACPFSYHLQKDFGFKIDSNEGINYGNIVHNSLETINKAVIEGKSLTDNDIKLIVSKVHDNYVDIINPFKKQETIENVLDYWHNYGQNLKILESEYEFTLYEKDYILSGAIDLIYQKDDGNLGIIDYKNAINIDDYKLNKYSEQIYTYINALKEDEKYKDKKVTEAYIYGTITKKPYKIDLNGNRFNQKNIIENTSKLIKKEEFDKIINSHCEWCMYNFICLDKRCPICGKPILDNMEKCSNCR